MNKKITFLLILFATQSPSFAMQGAFNQADAAIFAQKATKQLLKSQYKKLAINSGVLLATTLATGVGVRVALDFYKSTKDSIHRILWGPTQEDKIITMEFEKTKQFTLEKQQALKIAGIKLEQANLDYYTTIMEKRIARAKTSEEKDTLSQTCDDTLSTLTEIVKRRISAGQLVATT